MGLAMWSIDLAKMQKLETPCLNAYYHSTIRGELWCQYKYVHGYSNLICDGINANNCQQDYGGQIDI